MTQVKKQSKAQIEIKAQIFFIYKTLIKLGFPKILQLSLQKIEDIQIYLASYFQSTTLRMQLIQWFVAIIYPQYRKMQWYITQKDPLQKIIKSLWKIGVMPVNKHTKNLDYKKYVQAMLGYQNSVNLIYNLTQLAFQTILSKKSKNDLAFGQFFHQLVDNFSELINQNYDIYGITFPCKFINPSQKNQAEYDCQQRQVYLNEFEKQYRQFQEHKMKGLLQKQDQLLDRIYKQRNKSSEKYGLKESNKKGQTKEQQKEGENDIESQLQKMIKNLSKYSKEYHVKYSNLVQKIEILLKSQEGKSRMLPYYFEKFQQTRKNERISKYNESGQGGIAGDEQKKEKRKRVKQQIEKRSIKITKEMASKYIKYKKLVNQIKGSNDDAPFMSRREQLLTQLNQINQIICL